MDLLPTGSDKLLTVRTSYVDLVIKSKGKQIVKSPNGNEQSSSLKVVAQNVEQIYLPSQGITENYADAAGNSAHELLISPLFFEQTDYYITIRSHNGEKLNFQSNSSLLTEKVGYVIDSDPTLLSGVINFGNNVGFSNFYVQSNERTVLCITIEVYPSKISYKDDYREMMTDINNMVSESVLDFMKKSYQTLIPDHSITNVSAVFFTILKKIYGKYIQATNRIISLPHHKLINEYCVVDPNKARKTDIKSEKWIQKHPENIKKRNGFINANRILSVKKKTTFDTVENQLVKFIITSTLRKIDDFQIRYRQSSVNAEEWVLNDAKRMSYELRRILSSTFLKDVSNYNAAQSMSLVFGMAPGYRELYKYYLMLQNGLSLNGDIFHMSTRETSQLYEYWCFIKLYAILKEAKNEKGEKKYPLKTPDVIKVDRKGITVDLVKGKASRVVFENTLTGEQIILTYNPSESKTQTVNQRPDNVLELEKNGAHNTYKYIFDAKYRIETTPDEKFYPDSKPGPKVDDINTMHRYRDSIVYENKESCFIFEKTMFGAYILFPYQKEDEYESHHFYKSIESVNIGGLPFLPSATRLVTELLETLISDSPESAFERSVLPVGIEEKIKTVDWSRQDVMIGSVSGKAQLDAFLKNNCFCAQHFNKIRLPIRYIALYEKGEGIKYYGELISWSQTDSPLPFDENQLTGKYFIFNVHHWIRLGQGIKDDRLGRDTNSYTNLFLLLNAKTYSELHLRSNEEYRLYTELKRQTNAEIAQGRQQNEFIIGRAKIIITDDKMSVYVDNNLEKEYPISDFRKYPGKVFRRMMNIIQQSGVIT